MSKRFKITTSIFLCAALLFSYIHIGMFSAKGQKDDAKGESNNSSSVDGALNMDGISVDWNKSLSYLGG